jgi:hypothetical protein
MSIPIVAALLLAVAVIIGATLFLIYKFQVKPKAKTTRHIKYNLTLYGRVVDKF